MTEGEAGNTLREGSAIVGRILTPHGFQVSPIRSGTGSGGSYASCEFSRGQRHLRLHFRYSLGLVEYEVSGVTLSHEDFMWAVQGRRGAAKYPGFSKDPLDGFRHLAADIEQHGKDFLLGSDHDFAQQAERAGILRRTTSRIPE